MNKFLEIPELDPVQNDLLCIVQAAVAGTVPVRPPACRRR